MIYQERWLIKTSKYHILNMISQSVRVSTIRYRFRFAEPVKKRSKLVLPNPQISDSELEEVKTLLIRKHF